MRATRASWQTLLAVVVLLLHATSVTSFRVLDAKAPPTPNTIRIGFNGVKYAGNSTSDRPPLGSDTYRSILLSMQLWLSYLANTTDLLPGAEVQLLDNPYDFVVAGALVKTFELISAGSIALIGSTYSGATKLTTILTDSKFLPQCDGSSSSPELSNKAAYPRFFRTKPSDNLQAIALFDYIMSMGWRRVAIISETDAYGTGLTKAFRDQAQGTQLTIVLQQTFLLDALYNENSWDTILENIRSANVFVVIIFSESAHVVGLMPAIRAKGMMSSKYAWIGSDGMIGAIRQAPGLTVTFPSEGNGPAFAKFNELWDQHKMDINTTDKQNSLYSTKFVSCLELFLRGFDRYLRVTPGATLQRLAAGEYNPNFTSPATMFNFPEQYLPVGKILLDPTTGDPKSTYDIFNSQVVNGVATAVRVGSWDGISRNLTMDSPVTFGLEGSTIKPADDITLADYTSIVPSKSAMGALAIFFNMLAVGLIIAVGFVFHASRSRPILRKSSIPSMNVVLVGLLLPCLDVFTMVDVPTKTQCIADIWLVGLGFAFVLGAIATKLLRLYRIFNGIQTQIKGVSNNDLLIQTGIPILIEAVLLTLWTANDPPTPKLIQVNPLSYYYVCSSRSASFQTMMTVSLVTWNGLLLIICTILAVATRDIRADFNEAKVVGLCVYNQLVIVTVALPLLTTGVGSVAISVLFAVKQAAILIVVFATVAAVHGTKIYALIVDKDLPKHAMRQIDSESQRPVPGAAKPTAASAAGDQHDDSDDCSETDESSSESSHFMANMTSMSIQSLVPPMSSLLPKPCRRVYVTYKEPGVTSAWIAAELMHIAALDIVLLKRIKLHVTRKGQERGSRRTAQLFFSGPQLFLRDIRQLGMESDSRDDRILHIYTGKTMVLSIRFENGTVAGDFETLMYGRRSTVVNEGRSSSAAGGLWSMSANGDGQTRTITAAATNHGSSGEVDNHVSSVTSALSSSGNPILTPTNTRIQ